MNKRNFNKDFIKTEISNNINQFLTEINNQNAKIKIENIQNEKINELNETINNKIEMRFMLTQIVKHVFEIIPERIIIDKRLNNFTKSNELIQIFNTNLNNNDNYLKLIPEEYKIQINNQINSLNSTNGHLIIESISN